MVTTLVMIEATRTRLTTRAAPTGVSLAGPADSRALDPPREHGAHDSFRRCRGERGDVTPMVIMTPIAVFLIMWVIQMGLYFHARTVMTAAAQDGARAAQIENATVADAAAAANQILADSQNLLFNENVAVTTNVNEVTVTVTAEIQNVLPFWGGGVLTATASGPAERFRPQAER